MKLKKLLVLFISVFVLIIPNIVRAIDDIELKVGETKEITITQTATSWESSDSSVAEVSSGTVKAISEGTATITFTYDETTTDGELEVTIEKSESFKVTVVKDEPELSPSPEPIEVDLTLKGISITGGELTTSFSSKTNNYDVKITDASKFNIKVTLTDTNAKYIIGDFSNITSKNEVKIVVTDSENSKKNTYTLNILKEIANVNLASLKISGYAFNQSFNKDTLSYTVTVPYDVTEVTIQATPEDNNAKVSPGVSFTADELEVGGNTITIKVTNGNDSKTYRIFVTRSEEEKSDIKTTKIITSKGLSSGVTDDYDIPDTDDPDSIVNYIIITLGSLVLISIGGIGIYFYFKTSPKKMKKELLKQKEKKEENPIVEIKDNSKENLSEDTKEFKNE